MSATEPELSYSELQHRYQDLERRYQAAITVEREWERALGKLSAGEYDSVAGMALLFAKVRATREREEFIDAAAIRVVSGLGDPECSTRFAREAYDLAEALWEERRKRRNAR